MKFFYAFTLLLLLSKFMAQEPFLENGKFGFRENGKEIITPSYEYATHFIDGLAIVKINEIWGYINKENKVVVTPQFDKVEPLNEGFARVLLNGKYGLINSEGEIVLKPEYVKIKKIQSQTFLFQNENKKYGFYKEGWQTIPATYDEIIFYSDFANCRVNDQYDVYTETGLLVAKQKRMLSSWIIQDDDTFIANKEDLYGIFHLKFGWMIQPLYYNIEIFKISSYEEIDAYGDFTSFNHVYMLNPNDVDVKYDWKNKVEDLKIKVVKGGSLKEVASNISGYEKTKNYKKPDYKITNDKGTFMLNDILASKKEHLNYIIERVKIKDGSVVNILLDKNQIKDTLLVADDIELIKTDNYPYFKYKKNNLYGIYQKNINILPKYETIEVCQTDSKLLVLKNGNKMDLFDINKGLNSRLIFEYDENLKVFRRDYFPNIFVYQNEQYLGFDGRIYKNIDNDYFYTEVENKKYYLVNGSDDINEKDRKSSHIYSYLSETEFPNVFIAKGDNNKFGVINHQLDTLIPFNYSRIEEYFMDYNIIPNDILYLIYDGKKVGIYGLHSGLILNPEYTKIDNYYEDEHLYENYKIYNKKLFGLASFDGEVILSPVYTEIRSLNYDYDFFMTDLLKVVDKKGKIGVYNIKGEEVLPIRFDFFDIEMEYYQPQGYYEVLIKIIEKNKEGYFSNTKGLLVPALFDLVQDFYETDYNVYSVFQTKKGKNLKGIYDYHGNELFPCEFDAFHFYPEYVRESDTLVIFAKKENKYYVNVSFISENSLAQPFSYDNYYNYVLGSVGIKIKENKYHEYNLKTNQLVKTHTKSDTVFIKGLNYDVIFYNGKFGAKNIDGKITVPPFYDEASFMDGRSDIMIGYENGIKYYIYVETNERYTEEEW